MKINCQHGHFIFEETRSGEIGEFLNLYTGLKIVNNGRFLTFDFLKDAPDYSLTGLPYLGVPATKTFAGEPWDVMRENSLVYDYSLGLVVPKASVIRQARLKQASSFYLAPGLIVPGSLTEDGSRVMSYSAWYLFDTGLFKYSEVRYE